MSRNLEVGSATSAPASPLGAGRAQHTSSHESQAAHPWHMARMSANDSSQSIRPSSCGKSCSTLRAARASSIAVRLTGCSANWRLRRGALASAALHCRSQCQRCPADLPAARRGHAACTLNCSPTALQVFRCRLYALNVAAEHRSSWFTVRVHSQNLVKAGHVCRGGAI